MYGLSTVPKLKVCSHCPCYWEADKTIWLWLDSHCQGTATHQGKDIHMEGGRRIARNPVSSSAAGKSKVQV